MIIPRVIPVLCLSRRRLIKTRQFKDPVYVGDPINIINLFNQFEVDEISLLDIRASLDGYPPDFAYIEWLASECWVPLSYGGGVRNLEHVEQLFRCGVEKVIFNSALKDNQALIRSAIQQFGSQAIVASIDTKTTGVIRRHPTATVKSGTVDLKMHPTTAAQLAESLGVGEIFLNSIECDGTRRGFDLELIREVSSCVGIPVVAIGGAGDRHDIPRPINEAGASAVAAGSLFVFQQGRESVLVNFPERLKLEQLFQTSAQTPEL